MKKTLLMIIGILLVLLLAAGVYIVYSYVAADETAVVEPEGVAFMGVALAPASVEWHTPVVNGLLTKHFYVEADSEPQDLGSFGTAELAIEAPEGAALAIEWAGETAEVGQTVFAGAVADYADYSFEENGCYEVELVVAQTADTKVPWGTFTYRFTFCVDVPASVEISSTEALQGDIVTVLADSGLSGAVPEILTDLGAPVFVETGKGAVAGTAYAAYVPINYNCRAGEWDIVVTLGELTETYTVTVSGREYAEQHMDMPQSTTDATMNNPEGPANWKERIQPLWETADTAKYWTETFMQPCDGRVSSRFGLYRYTNGNPIPRRHTGIDLAIGEGTPVAASNGGRVVLAEEIIYTGNTAVIEHGGGLKTYYFHLSRLDCAVDDMVEKGDIIGLVGSTGYSTGPHLHFEVKIGKTSLSPWELFDGSSGVYFQGDI